MLRLVWARMPIFITTHETVNLIMKINQEDAYLLMYFLEIATATNWPVTIRELHNHFGDYEISKLYHTWEKLQKISGLNGMVPCRDELDLEPEPD